MRLSDEAVALISAALRHVRDAEWLAHADRSPDQAYHLGGYGPECARKACLRDRRFDQTIGHRFERKIEDVLDVATALDPWALRYEPRDWAERYPALAAWRETSRYERTGTRSSSNTRALVSDARQAVNAVVLALWTDGRLPDGAEPW